MAGSVVHIPPERDENSVDADESYLTFDQIIVCGQLVDAAAPNNTETFIGLSIGPQFGAYTEHIIGGGTCNTYDSTNEATIERPILAKMPNYKVSGFWCVTNVNADNDVTFTLRKDQADTTPVLSCTIPGTGTSQSCGVEHSTGTNFMSTEKLAIKVTYSENLDANDAWCKLYFAAISK
jgi:hypothetical protein